MRLGSTVLEDLNHFT